MTTTIITRDNAITVNGVLKGGGTYYAKTASGENYPSTRPKKAAFSPPHPWWEGLRPKKVERSPKQKSAAKPAVIGSFAPFISPFSGQVIWDTTALSFGHFSGANVKPGVLRKVPRSLRQFTLAFSGFNLPSELPAQVLSQYSQFKTYVKSGKVAQNSPSGIYLPRPSIPRSHELNRARSGNIVSYDDFLAGKEVLPGRQPVFGQVRPRKSFAKPPKRGSYEEHTYSLSITKKVYGLVTQTILPNTQTFFSTDGFVAPVTSEFGWSSNDDLALLGKIRERVAGSDFNAGVFLGEGKQSCAMIANAAVRIAKAISFVKKGQPHKALQVFQSNVYDPVRRKKLRSLEKRISVRNTAANNWLELQYGWLPLLQDAEAGAQFLAHHFSVPLQWAVKVSRETKMTKVPDAQRHIQVHFTSRRKTLKVLLKEKDTVALAGLTDPLSVAWELLPYSFVVDWFIPIGNFLAARGLSQALTTGPVITSQIDRGSASGFYGPDTASVRYSNPACSNEYVSFQRTKGTALNAPLPSIKPLEKVASWRHAANAVALLSQKVR